MSSRMNIRTGQATAVWLEPLPDYFFPMTVLGKAACIILSPFMMLVVPIRIFRLPMIKVR